MSEIRSGSDDSLNTPRDFGANCLNAFLSEISDDISGACMIPIQLPQDTHTHTHSSVALHND